MLILDAVTKSLKVVLDEAASTQLPITAHYTDITTTLYTPGSNDTVTNSTTVVEFVGAPAASTQRHIESITVYNADNVSHAVTIQYVSAGGTRNIIKVTIQPGEQLYYEDGMGWQVCNTSGAVVTSVSVPVAGIPVSSGTAWGASLAGTAESDFILSGASPFAWAVKTLAQVRTILFAAMGNIFATTINKITITQPATGSTLTIADGKTLTVSENTTLSGGTHSGTNTGDETAARIATIITGAGAETTPLDADEFTFYKIVGTVLKKVTWANIKATLLTWIDTLFSRKGDLKQNLLSNSGFGVWSNSTLENVGSEMTVTQITSGVCTTTNTQGLAVGKLVKFGAGGTTAVKKYEVTALTANTNFTINDTSITDATDVTCYEVTPGCVAADTSAPDKWLKESGLKLWRYLNLDNSKVDGGDYGLEVEPHATNDLTFYQTLDSKTQKSLMGKTGTIGAYVYCTAIGQVKIGIKTGGTWYWSAANTTAGALEWLEYPKTSAAATAITDMGFMILAHATPESYHVWLSPAMGVKGSSIGEGNYQPMQGEEMLCEAAITVTPLSSTTGYSDVGSTTLNLEAACSGKIPKGARKILLYCSVNDSGSAGTICYLVAGSPAWTATWSPYGLANDTTVKITQQVILDSSGDMVYTIEASGSGTFDIASMKIMAVQL